MVLVRVLQRKDAASLVVAIAAGLSVFNFVSAVTAHLTAVLSGSDYQADMTADYWRPFVALVLQLLVLEVLARIVIAINGQVGK